MNNSPLQLTISIVTYLPEQHSLTATLESLKHAIFRLSGIETLIWIIDNSPTAQRPAWLKNIADMYSATLIHGHGNIGFGQGHNLILELIGDFHLILNPDVELVEDALSSAIDFMNHHQECGLLAPATSWADGSPQFLCKRFPSLLDLFLRGFAPDFMKSWFRSRLDHYEMRDVIGNTTCWDPPIVSGCCMLFRKNVLLKLSGFAPSFFLYFEDFDISLRAARLCRIAYFPGMRIIHHGGHAARKGWPHIAMFATSALKFFNKHGWRLS